MEGLREPVNPRRDLAWPGRVLRAALAMVDLINPMLATDVPLDISSNETDRDAHVASMLEARRIYRPHVALARMREWAARAGLPSNAAFYIPGDDAKSTPKTYSFVFADGGIVPDGTAALVGEIAHSYPFFGPLPSETPDRGRATSTGASLHSLRARSRT